MFDGMKGLKITGPYTLVNPSDLETGLAKMKLEERKEIKSALNSVYGPVLDYASEEYHQSHFMDVREEFYGFASSLKRRGIMSSGMRVYFPAANIQIETEIFSSMFDGAYFVGGDIVKNPVVAGKKRIGDAENVDFVVGDAFFTPFRGLDAIIDHGGAMWYAGLAGGIERSADNFRFLFYQYHKALSRGGYVIIDRHSMNMIGLAAPSIFEEVVKYGKIEFDVCGYKVRFDARRLGIEEGDDAWLFEKNR